MTGPLPSSSDRPARPVGGRAGGRPPRARLPGPGAGTAGTALLLALALTALSPARGSLFLPEPAAGQQTEELRQRGEERLGRELSDQEIIRMIRQSGLSPGEIRDRLEQRGFDREAADPWLSVVEGEAGRVPEGARAGPVLSVLGGGGVRPGGAAAPGPRPRGEVPPPGRRAEPAPGDEGPPVFGRAIFRRSTSQFQPVTTGPVPPDYRVGPGDQLVLVLTGAVEQAYELRVSREGWVVVPEVGRVFVNGRTVEELRRALRDRLAESYSSLEGEEPSTRFDLTLGELRTNQVYVIGAVERPGAYTVSSLATALTALYHAGGPTRNGSFRRIRVNRGGETVRSIDLYRYLVEGSAEQDVRLQQGDIVFVPIAETRVRIEGPVSRPGIYGLRGGEGLADLLRFAGGVQPNADLERVQIHRILPPEERAPGVDRSVLDVPVGDLRGAEEADIPLEDGDRVTVFAVLDEARNEVSVTGGVWRPGTYGTTDSTRLWDVIEKAGGLLPDAYEGRAQIQRLQEHDRSRRLIPVSLARDSAGTPRENPRIEGQDQIIVYARRDLREDRAVSIGGWVRNPGVFPFVEGMTVADLVLEAGGLRTGAYTATAEVARVKISQTRQDTLTETFRVALDSSLVFDGRAADGDTLAIDDSEAARFELENLDAVYVRRAPGFDPQQRVVVTGEVAFPGPYSLQTRDERLTDLVERAGGLTEQAYPEGFQLWRRGAGGARGPRTAGQITGEAVGDTTVATDGGAAERPPRAGTALGRTRVGVDFVAARRNPDAPQNVFVEPGDSIHVPAYNPTVTVRGAVGVETRVLHREGADLGYYIDRAGGYAENADEDRTRIRFANGEVATKGGGFLFFGGAVPPPDPGSVITVPAKPRRERKGLSTGQFITLITSVLGTAATVIAATN